MVLSHRARRRKGDFVFWMQSSSPPQNPIPFPKIDLGQNHSFDPRILLEPTRELLSLRPENIDKAPRS